MKSKSVLCVGALLGAVVGVVFYKKLKPVIDGSKDVDLDVSGCPDKVDSTFNPYRTEFPNTGKFDSNFSSSTYKTDDFGNATDTVNNDGGSDSSVFSVYGEYDDLDFDIDENDDDVFSEYVSEESESADSLSDSTSGVDELSTGIDEDNEK